MLFIYRMQYLYGTLPPISSEPLETSLSADIAHDPQRPDNDPENAYEYSSLHLYLDAGHKVCRREVRYNVRP